MAATLSLSAIPTSSKSGVVFVDVTESSGIRFEHVSDAEKRYIVESMSGGVALFDFDGDGLLDIYFVNSQTVSQPDPRSAPSHLYRNLGNWRFEEVGRGSGTAFPGWGMGVCVGDYDGDGRVDLYVTAFGKNRLYRNEGRGGFREVGEKAGVADPRWSTGCTFADFDSDGDLDLFVANYVDFKLDHLPEFGKGASCQYQGLPVQCGPRGLRGAGDSLFRNRGDGTFENHSAASGVSDPDGYYGLGAVWTDFDDDGKVDLFVANDGRPNYFYRNQGNGTLKDYGFLSGAAVAEDGGEQACMGIAVGDYDQDGRLDLFSTNFSNEYNVLYRNEGGWLVTDRSYPSRTATEGITYVGWGTFFFDFDNDGFLDLLAVNGHVYPQVQDAGIGISYRQPKLLFRGLGGGSFQNVSQTSGSALREPRSSRGAAYGDLDNDGDLDIVVNDLDGAPMLLRNDGGNRAHWLILDLNPRKPGPSPIGARVHLRVGQTLQIGEVRSGGSYLSQSDMRLHFGLGKATRVDLIEVRWPDGRVTRRSDVKVDRIIRLRP